MGIEDIIARQDYNTTLLTRQCVVLLSRSAINPNGNVIATINSLNLKTVKKAGSYLDILDKDGNRIAEITAVFSMNIGSKAAEIFTGNEDHTVNVLNTEVMPPLLLIEIIASIVMYMS